MKKLLKFLLLIMPACLFLSYHPLMRFGESETMYFELSVAMIWLVMFDVVAVVIMWQEKLLFKGLKNKWVWILFPVWLTLSIAWSLNVTRGVLTAGVLWLVYIAGYGMWTLREILGKEFWMKWVKWLMITTLVVCGWCLLQCILDLAGVGQNTTLLCDGCTYQMFGFPHPNGFAIEPQFMGNLLLAPAMIAMWLYLFEKQVSKKTSREHSRGVIFITAKSDSARYCSTGSSSVAVVKMTTGSRFLCSVFLLTCFFIITTTLFLTFSRGAIYAFLVGVVVMGVMVLVREKKRKGIGKRIGVLCLTIITAFIVSLVAQGVMAEVSPTDDTFQTGVAKVLNHLSLGIIDIREKGTDVGESTEEAEPVENFQENSGDESVTNLTEESPDKQSVVKKLAEKSKAVFNGYVAESTDTRVRLTGAAFQIWASEPKIVLVGVGLGGAGQALYNNGLSPAPREIVQNEYASLLLETGVIGLVLFCLTIVLIVRAVLKLKLKAGLALVIALLVAYAITLMFFSGLANALQIYLMPVPIIMTLMFI